MQKHYDVVVVGAGIVGLAHAYEARQRGMSVLVLERSARCVGASVRNFGFVTVSGQAGGDTWRRARRSREVWNEIAPHAGIPIVHRGSWIVCQRAEALRVAEEFLTTEMGEGCTLYRQSDFSDLIKEFPNVQSILLEDAKGLLYSPLELRVESREAIGQLASWLAKHHSVDFKWRTEAYRISESGVETSAGEFQADRVIFCTGADTTGVVASALANYTIQLCTLQMLRIRPSEAITLPGSIMTDNSLARYLGWANLASAAELKKILALEVPELLEAGIHLIVVQSADGSLVVGDSHVYGDAESVFARAEIDNLILNLARNVINLKGLSVEERWTGVYPVMPESDALIHKVSDRHTVAIVTSGTGASTAFGLAKDTFDGWGE